MRVLMRDHVAKGGGLVPIDEIVDRLPVLGRAVMLERRVQADVVAELDQKVVVIVVAPAEQPVRLLHERPVEVDDRRRHL